MLPISAFKAVIDPAVQPKGDQGGGLASSINATGRTCALLAKHAATLPGLGLMAEGVASQGVGHLPMLVFPYLAPLCVSPPARIALVAATVAAPIMLRPFTHVLGTGIKDYFIARFVVAEQRTLTDSVTGHTQLNEVKGVAARAKSQVMDGHYKLARDVATLLNQAVPLGITIGLSIITFSSGVYASPVLVAAAIGMELLPIIIRVFSQKPRQRSAAQVTAADEKFRGHMERFWQKTAEGTDASQAAWQETYEEHIEATCKARIKKASVEQLCTTAESIPSTLNAVAAAVPSYSTSIFNQTYEVVTTHTLANYHSITTAAHGLFSAVMVATAFRDIHQSLSAQEHLQEDIAEVIETEAET